MISRSAIDRNPAHPCFPAMIYSRVYETAMSDLDGIKRVRPMERPGHPDAQEREERTQLLFLQDTLGHDLNNKLGSMYAVKLLTLYPPFKEIGASLFETFQRVGMLCKEMRAEATEQKGRFAPETQTRMDQSSRGRYTTSEEIRNDAIKDTEEAASLLREALEAMDGVAIDDLQNGTSPAISQSFTNARNGAESGLAMLDYFSKRFQGIEEQREMIDINAIVGHHKGVLVQMVSYKRSERPGSTRINVEFSRGEGGEPLLVHSFPIRLGQALENLVGNAGGAIDPDAAAGRIVVASGTFVDREGAHGTSGARYATISVGDNGKGMDEETKRRAFEAYFTRGKEGGTGIGLAQVDALVKDSGGFITLESTLGKGTTFTLHFPLSDQNPREGIPPAIA